MNGKTVLFNCSPKKNLSVSGFIMQCTGLMIHGDRVYTQLRTPADRKRALSEIKDADKVVFVTPLYVDGLPSHVVLFLKDMEAICRENGLHLKVYAVANSGFIEGKQNEPLMQVLENFCHRSGLKWCGAVGIGGGVMLNVTRIMICVSFALSLLNVVLNGVQGESMLEPIISFGKSLLLNLALCSGIIAYTIRLTQHINRGTDAGRRYTRIMLPSFVFILFADAFFIIISVLQGGVFRGWLSRFQSNGKIP